MSDSLLARAERTETLICSEETFSQLTGETGYTILDVQFRFGSDEEDVAEVEALFGEGVTFTDVLIQAQQQRGLYYAFCNIGIWFPVNHCSHYDFPYYEYHQHGSFRPNSPIWSNACHWHE